MVTDFPLWPGHYPLAEAAGFEVRRGIDPTTGVDVIVFNDAETYKYVACIADAVNADIEAFALRHLTRINI